MAERAYTVYAAGPARFSWRVAVITAMVVLGGLAGSAAFLARSQADHLPPGVEIEGIAVGGLSVADARNKVEQHEAAVAAAPIALTYEGGSLTTSGSELGAQADVDDAIAVALESRDAFSRLRTRVGLTDPVQIPLHFTVDPADVDAVLDRVRDEVERRPRPARVVLQDDEVVVRRARAGRVLDVDAAVAALAGLPDRVALVVTETQPAITDEVAEQAKATADILLSTPPAVMHKQRSVELQPAVLREALRFETDDGSIDVRLDPEPLEQPLHAAFRRFEKAPKDASSGCRQPRQGRGVSDGQRRLGAEDRDRDRRGDRYARGPGRLRAEPAGADHTRGQGDEDPRAGLRSSPPRIRAARHGSRTSSGRLRSSTGTSSRPAGASRSTRLSASGRPSAASCSRRMSIRRGRLEDAIGGGVSQVATTFYNAAFFAGLDLIAHTPHQFYVSRYPMGREATVSWGGPELIFRNDWPAAILVKVSAGDTSITVRFYSSKLGRKVETETGEPYAYTSATTLRVFNPALAPGTESVVQSGGVSGFSVAYTRQVYRDGKQIRDERWVVRYDPENTIVEYGPKPTGGGGGSSTDAASGGGGGGGAGGTGGDGGGGSGGGGGGSSEPPPQDSGGGEPPPPPS